MQAYSNIQTTAVRCGSIWLHVLNLLDVTLRDAPVLHSLMSACREYQTTATWRWTLAGDVEKLPSLSASEVLRKGPTTTTACSLTGGGGREIDLSTILDLICKETAREKHNNTPMSVENAERRLAMQRVDYTIYRCCWSVNFSLLQVFSCRGVRGALDLEDPWAPFCP